MDRLREKREQRHTEAKDNYRLHIQELGDARRNEAKALEDLRQRRHEAHWKQARERVEYANGLDDRLDAEEAAQDKREQEEAAEARRVLNERAAKANKAKNDHNSRMVGEVP